MTAADYILILQPVVGEPASADQQVVQSSIEHGNACGRVFDKEPHFFAALMQRSPHNTRVVNIAARAEPFDDISRLISHGHGAYIEPAISAIPSAYTRLGVKRRSVG